MSNINKIGLSVFIILSIYTSITCGIAYRVSALEQEPMVFSTWDGFEVDKCASIWLIKRFIDRDAIISFLPKGEVIKEGIPFDTPDAKLRRYYNMSTFETILKNYKLDNPKLVHIGKIIHDIEVNTWEKKVFNETLKVQDAVNNIIWNSKSSKEVIRETLEYFDSIYKKGIK
jgi:hypothetical protein